MAEAVACYRNGDAHGAIDIIRSAMESLATLAVSLDPTEAALMRAISDHFSSALLAGDKHTAKNAVNVMRHKAGDSKNEPHSDW